MLSPTLLILAARFPGRILITFSESANAISMAVQTARNLDAAGKFPIPTHKVGGRRMVRIDDLAAYLDKSAPPAGIKKKRRRGRPSNVEKFEGQQGFTTFATHQK